MKKKSNKKKEKKEESVKVQDLLVVKKLGLTDKKLSFDHDTGELIVSEDPNPNSIVVDQIYKDGFF